MEKYQIIPRKFRPKRFAEVAHHEAIVTTLKNALRLGHVGQAYLFCGARGSGKTTLARLFAKALNCTQLSADFEPCNDCVNCQEIAEGRSLDVIEIDGASNRGIDDIRQINETVGYVPHRGSYKIYIIDEVHMLTKEAFNALLKTLEEPPKNVKFFFATTEPHKLPSTILSRCQRFNLARLPQKAVTQKLQRICTELGIQIDTEALAQISHLAEGSLRDAESLLDQLICFGKSPITLATTREAFGLIPKELLLELDRIITGQNIDQTFALAKQLFESGRDLSALIDSFLEHFRTHLHLHFDPKPKTPFTKQECLNILEILLDWQQRMQKSPFQRIHLEMLLVHLVRSFKRIPLDALLTRLIDLEQRLNNEPVALPPVVAPIEQKIITPPPAPPPKNEVHPSKYDTLLHFAAIELEGTVQNLK